MKLYYFLIVMLSFVGFWAMESGAQTDTDLQSLLKKVIICTTIEPPYQIQEQGHPLTGVSVELVQLMLKKAGLDMKIEVYPWSRAYEMAQTQPNVILFSILRNPQREKLFKWVGALHPFQVFFYRLKDRPDIVVNTLADAKKYKIGVLRDDSRNIYLRSQGFGANLEEVTSDAQNIKKLFDHRIELLPSDPIVLAYWFKILKYDPTQVEKIFHVDGADGENYIVISAQTDERVVEYFRQAFARAKELLQYQQILNKYLK